MRILSTALSLLPCLLVGLAASGVPAARAAGPWLSAVELRRSPRRFEYPRSPRGTEVVRIGDLSLGEHRGLELRLAAATPAEVRVYLVMPDGSTRVRHVSLTPARSAVDLRVAFEDFDPVPTQTWDRVAPGGTILVAEQAGFRRLVKLGRLSVGPLRLLPEAPPTPTEQVPAGPPGDALEDRILGGWVGKVLGGQLGMPGEGEPAPDWEALDALPDAETLELPPEHGFGPDDDTGLGVQALLLTEELGRFPSPMKIAGAWMTTFQPELHWKNGWSSLLRIAGGTRPPASGRGPLGETLSARIRIEPWAFLRPGRPAEAACLARRDARITSHGAGEDDAAFWAAALSAAFTAETPAGALEEAGRLVGGRYLEVLERARGARAEGLTLRQAWERLAAEEYAPLLEEHPEDAWVFSLPNAGLLGLALAWGDGDLARTLYLAAHLGWDADCNAATLGCLLGVHAGSEALPERLVASLEDRLRVPVAGVEHWSLHTLAARTRALARRLESRPACDPGHDSSIPGAGKGSRDSGENGAHAAPGTSPRPRKGNP